MRLTDDLEQSQKREGSLQVLRPDDLVVAGDDKGGDGVIMMVQMNTITTSAMLFVVNKIMIVS